MFPWHLDLGRIEQHALAIEQLGRERVLCFEPPIGGTSWPLTRIAVVQPGYQVELPPWRGPARSLILPWAKAPLDDLWLLLCAGARRSWFEVPYGVWRAPGEHRDSPQLGPPRSPPDAAAPEDLVLPWQTIRFKLGPASGWQLALVARQSRTGELELEARRGEPGIPPAIALAASVGARPLAIEQPEAWGAEPAPLHVARYRFPPVPLGARSYVRLLVRSGAASFELQLPTSLTDRSHRSAHRREPAR
jgi:hypothetical protein